MRDSKCFPRPSHIIWLEKVSFFMERDHHNWGIRLSSNNEQEKGRQVRRREHVAVAFDVSGTRDQSQGRIGHSVQCSQSVGITLGPACTAHPHKGGTDWRHLIPGVVDVTEKYRSVKARIQCLFPRIPRIQGSVSPLCVSASSSAHRFFFYEAKISLRRHDQRIAETPCKCERRFWPHLQPNSQCGMHQSHFKKSRGGRLNQGLVTHTRSSYVRYRKFPG